MSLINRMKIRTLEILIPAHYSKETILSLIDNFDIISFDMFDTLVMRNIARPTDLFLILEEKYQLKNFCIKRIAAEQEARKLKSEIKINDIYERLSENDKCFPINKIMLDELKLEKIICKQNFFMKDIYEQIRLMGKKIIIISDMYLSEKFLNEILITCGYINFSNLFVSCEYGISKYEGLLQKRIKNNEGIKHCIHIGDNVISDVIRSRAVGWKTIYYPKTKEMKKICNREGDWHQRVADGIYINALYDELLSVGTDYKNGFKAGWLEIIKEKRDLLDIPANEDFVIGKKAYYKKYNTVMTKLEAFMANT